MVALSNVVYPSISKNYEEGNIDYVKGLIQHMITLMFLIFTPFILTVCCYGKNIIGLLYERGEFTAELTVTTAVLFAIYTLGVFGYVCQELFNKILYLDSKYSYTVIGTLIVIAIKPIVNLFLADYGVIYVAAATSVLFTLYAINIAVAMKKIIGKYLDKALLTNLLKIFTACGCALLVHIIFKLFFPVFSEGKLMFIVPLGFCAAAYIFVLLITGIIKSIMKKTD